MTFSCPRAMGSGPGFARHSATGLNDMKRALITGVTGQDGAYLSQLLLDKGYEVYGLLRRSSASDVVGTKLRWLGIEQKIKFIDGDLIDVSSLLRAMRDVAPDEVYNLAAQSFVKTSWAQPLL